MGVAPQASPSDALFFICMSKEPYRELSVFQSAEASFARLTEKFTVRDNFYVALVNDWVWNEVRSLFRTCCFTLEQNLLLCLFDRNKMVFFYI